MFSLQLILSSPGGPLNGCRPWSFLVLLQISIRLIIGNVRVSFKLEKDKSPVFGIPFILPSRSILYLFPPCSLPCEAEAEFCGLPQSVSIAPLPFCWTGSGGGEGRGQATAGELKGREDLAFIPPILLLGFLLLAVGPEGWSLPGARSLTRFWSLSLLFPSCLAVAEASHNLKFPPTEREVKSQHPSSLGTCFSCPHTPAPPACSLPWNSNSTFLTTIHE